jgi:uncharacterized membrane protein YeaQ/YmgE (transglycosylase-associated protein family)
MVLMIFTWLATGLVVGGLGRFLIPGRNRIGLLLTILIGIVGAVAGGGITRVLEGPGHDVISFLFALLIAAVLVALISGPEGRRGNRR